MSRTTAVPAIMPTYSRRPVEFVSGRGALLWDAAGRRYIDMLAGIAVTSVGHCHPKVVAAIKAQSERLIHASNLFDTAPQTELAARLSSLTGGMLSFFCNSGAEAVECALKLARKRGSGRRRPTVVCAQGSFHGRTFGALAATGQPAKRRPFAPMLEGFLHVPFGDAEALARAVDDSTVAVLLEPIQGEAGVVVPPENYLPAVRAVCDERGIPLILDEVQTGLARTGRWFAHEHYDVRPEIMCLAKALGGGLPMGACLADPQTASAFVPGDHASTLGGGPVQSAAALAVLDVIESEGLVERAAALGRSVMERLTSALSPEATVRGKGLLLAIQFQRPVAAAITTEALRRGVVVNDVAPDAVRLAPPLVISDGEIDQALDVIEEIAREV